MTHLPVIECKELTLGYNSDPVLKAVSLKINRGAIIPLVGPNGAGKTTLLKAFVGLIPKMSGTITCHFGEKPPGYVPQQKQIDPLFPVSIQDIIAMGLYPEVGFWRPRNHDIKKRIHQTLDRFGLMDYRNKTFGELSGGTKQKALLARAFISGAHELILDEPFSGLDAATEHYLLNHLVDLNKNEGRTIILAHHRMEDLSFLSKSVYLVEHQNAVYIPATEAIKKMQEN